MKIVFLPMDAYGHVNACIGLANMLRDFGHDCTFAVVKQWQKPVEEHQFKVEILNDPTIPEDQDMLYKWGKFMNDLAHTFSAPLKDQQIELMVPSFRAFINFVKLIDPQLPEIFEKTQPDLIIMDFYVTIPSVIKSGRPWARLYSCNPLGIYEGDNVPPSGFGLALNTDISIFKELKVFMTEIMKDLKSEFDEWLLSKNIEPDPYDFISSSAYLNVYVYPSDLDYSELGSPPEKWFRLDHLVRKVKQESFGFDESFFDKPGKKVFFTLGSMGSSDIELMKRLISIMGQSEHQFIISKGPFHDKFQLAGNMVGNKYVNQMAILPKVDLVIHHGGNNTFIETLYFGKPCIVLPLSGDQHDNGRRVEDTGIGRCLNPYQINQDQFLSTIDQLLNDEQITKKVNETGEKIRNSSSIEGLNTKINQLISTHVKV
ncbi:uncharacterized UDP-glucosyltransferase YjiC-like [Tetranychus urticae]|uniref:UDP-glycosyltransferase 203D1 n=1 Tax=Tetranychus urticae TaxID=32264 RepID=T1KG72_TETUR|nr:uncharacterized UDP-glucosyltransferase YjiC-like [Tetranychus urticae]AHX56898.1 UDP-glycosyltransferase 203D1 [Tetranychus urticae]